VTFDDAAPAQLEGQSILLVEDNKINQDLAREILMNAGLKVTVADNGKEALEILEQASFFAVLMDLRMPVMDGIDAIKHIRANSHLAHLPVIALSAGVLKNEVEEALASGFDHYLSKPVDFDELLQLLNNVGGFADTRTVRTRPEPERPAPMPSELEIRGIDFGKALRNHDHDTLLLSRLMNEFLKIYEDADEQLKQLLDEGDTTRAERLVHNVAGVSGSFGAVKLMDASRAIEHQLIDGDQDLGEKLTTFSWELTNFARAIESYQEEIGARPKTGTVY
jgi:CheY-like chemotaxis protein